MVKKASVKQQADKKGALGVTSAAPQPPTASHVRDVDVINQDAATRAERRTVLMSALANNWAAEDIDTVERIDENGWHGWVMWSRA